MKKHISNGEKIEELVINEIIATAESEEQLNFLEKKYIEEAKNGPWEKYCWNIASGGEGGNTLKYMTSKQRESFCNKSRGKNNGMFGKGYKLKGKNNGMFGKKHSDSYIEKYLKGENNPMFGKGYLVSGERNGMFGKTHSDDTKLKYSKMRSNEGNPMAKTVIVTFENGETEEYGTMKEVSSKFKISRPTLMKYMRENLLYKKFNCYFSGKVK